MAQLDIQSPDFSVDFTDLRGSWLAQFDIQSPDFSSGYTDSRGSCETFAALRHEKGRWLAQF